MDYNPATGNPVLDDRLMRLADSEICTSEDVEQVAKRFRMDLETWFTEGSQAERDEIYGTRLWAAVAQVFEWQKEYDLAKGDLKVYEPDLLIQLVGFSRPPLRLVARALKPKERHLLLYSEQTRSELDCLLKDFEEDKEAHLAVVPKPSNGDLLLIDSSDPVNVYKTLFEVLEEMPYSPESVAVDITGGKKTMVAGGLLLAALRIYPLYYVDFKDYYQGVPVPGTEFLSRLVNPYDLLGVRKQQEVSVLFESHSYEPVEKLLSPIEEPTTKHLGETSLPNQLNTLRVVAAVYRHWDTGEIGEALTDLDHAPAWIQERHRSALTTLVETIEWLSDTKDTSRRPSLYLNEPNKVLRLALDRYAGACRRMETHQYDDAAVRLVGVIEHLAMLWLMQKEPNLSQADKKEAFGRLSGPWALVNGVLGECPYEAEVKKKNGVEVFVFDLTGTELVMPKREVVGESRGPLSDALKIRNDLVHRTSEEAMKAAQVLKSVAENMLRFCFEAFNKGFDEALTQHKFAEYNDITKAARQEFSGATE